MRETPRPQGTADGAEPVRPQCRPGRAFAHTTGALRSGHPHRSDGRPPHTPRGARHPGPHGGLGTSPPVPGPPAWRRRLMRGIFPALCALLFVLISWQIAARGPLRALDEDLGRSVSASSAPGGSAQFLADLGNASVAVPVLIAAMVASVLLRRRHRPRPWLPSVWAALAMAAVPAVIVPVKAWIGRTGPPAMAASGVHDGFFPSGHTATAAVAYGAALLLLMPPLASVSRARPHAGVSPPPHAACARTAPHAGSAPGSTPPHARPSSRIKPRNRHARGRAWAAIAYVVLNAGVAAGLVRCGYHWPLDVVGAWCLSGVLLWGLAQALMRPAHGRGSRPPHASRAPAARGR
ncbi:phosphatase PAP2 family protein [Streptomyces roseoverticillatus]|uniref:phosphatase PAP2 family protein n=1 Tax=Streptomyces roseoverticillatus TaxID=66429 RepID=UPI0027E43613|nr:phosphatase PAP2 family protein [Streptomyces roseoverticillatus]